MKAKVKGFTLVECIVAMALIAIASLFMAQIYSSLSIIERNNKMLSTTLQEQMEKVERESTDEGNGLKRKIVFGYDSALPGTKSSSAKIEFKKLDGTKHYSEFTLEKDTPNIDVIVYYAEDDRTSSTDAYQEGRTYSYDKTIRYKFILPKPKS